MVKNLKPASTNYKLHTTNYEAKEPRMMTEAFIRLTARPGTAVPAWPAVFAAGLLSFLPNIFH